MPQAKQTSKLKRRSKALPVLGAAGLSLSLASFASAVPSGLGDMPTSKTGDDNRVTLGEEDIAHGSLVPFYAFNKESQSDGVTLGEEEISDVSLATFYVFDKENAAKPQLGDKVAWRCGCGRCGCARCGCGWRGCAGCAGCGGCCWSWGRCRPC